MEEGTHTKRLVLVLALVLVALAVVSLDVLRTPSQSEQAAVLRAYVK